jgi:hypothetical protein
MKKYAYAVVCTLFALSAASLSANTSITGAHGYFTIPITSTPEKGELDINTGYIFDPGNFYLSGSVSFVKNWEISSGKEILTDEGQETGATPWIIGTKYMFYEKGGFRAATGLQVEIAGDAAGVDGTPVSLYGVISDNVGKLGYINLGLGYTLGIDAGYNINFFAGMRSPIWKDKLFFIGEFTNYSVRQGQGLPWNVNRGVFNAGLVLEPTDFLKFKFATYDLLDKFLTVGLGAEVKLKLF